MADDMGEKTEEPTAKRLADARKKGQVAKSQDMGSAAALLTATLVIWLLGGRMLEGMGIEMRRALAFDTPGGFLDIDGAAKAVMVMMRRGAMTALPAMLIAFAVVFVVQYVQIGNLWSTEQLKPKFSKFNPVNGFKKLFGLKGQVKNGLNMLKISAAIGTAGVVLWLKWSTLASLPRLSMEGALLMAGITVLEMAACLLVILVIIGVIDFVYQKWQHKRDLKMTKHEVKEERRSMEGDAGVKKRRFSLYVDMIRQQIQSGVPQADVIVTNPTHFSVAIKYDGETMRAPRVVAKGADLLAFRIRELAGVHGVPIVRRPPLARALYAAVDVGGEISPEYYEAVAEVLAYVYRMDAEAKRGSGSVDTEAQGSAEREAAAA